MLLKHAENIVLQPRRMPKLHGVSMSLRQLSKEFVESVAIFAQHRWQLPKNGAQMFFEWRDSLKENCDRLRLDFQLFHLRNEAASLHSLNEPIRSAVVPRSHALFERQPVKSGIDFDGVELGRVKLQMLARRQSFGIKRASPALVNPATGADKKPSHALI